MKSKFGKFLCTAVSTAAVVGTAALVVKKIMGRDKEYEPDDSVNTDDDEFEEIFSDKNKDSREYVTINITDDEKKEEISEDETDDEDEAQKDESSDGEEKDNSES